MPVPSSPDPDATAESAAPSESGWDQHRLRLTDATLASVLDTVLEREALSEDELVSSLEALGPERVGESFWERFGGPLTDRVEDLLVAVRDQGAGAAWVSWEGLTEPAGAGAAPAHRQDPLRHVGVRRTDVLQLLQRTQQARYAWLTAPMYVSVDLQRRSVCHVQLGDQWAAVTDVTDAVGRRLPAEEKQRVCKVLESVRWPAWSVTGSARGGPMAAFAELGIPWQAPHDGPDHSEPDVTGSDGRVELQYEVPVVVQVHQNRVVRVTITADRARLASGLPAEGGHPEAERIAECSPWPAWDFC